MEATVLKHKITYEDYYALDDGKRYELIEGELFMSPAPIPRHQKIIERLIILIDRHIENNSVGGELYISPVDVILADDEVVQPDLLYISQNRLHIIKERGIFGVPDLCIEIVSPNSEKRDMVEKVDIYHRYGVQEYIAVDYEAKKVYQFLADDDFAKNTFEWDENLTIKTLDLELNMNKTIKK